MGLKGNLALALCMVLKDRARELQPDDQQAALDAFLPMETEAVGIMARVFELAGTDACFVTARNDEPLFVLRAQDKLAPEVVEHWAAEYALDEREALALAKRMRAWQRANGVPD